MPSPGGEEFDESILATLNYFGITACAMREVKSGSHIHERIGIGRGAEFELQQHTNWKG